MNSIPHHGRRRGISLIEGVLYLVIALAVIVGGIVFFQQAQLSNNVTATARAAVGISSQTRALYHDQQSFGDNAPLTAAVVKAGAVPSTFVAGDPAAPTIEHPFDGPVTITGQGRGFVVSFAGISRAACIRLGSVDPTGQGPLGTGITGLTISSEGAVDPAAAPEMTGAITAEAISDACADEAEMAVYYAATPGGAGPDDGTSGADGGNGSGDDGSGGDVTGGDVEPGYVSMKDTCGTRPSLTSEWDDWEACNAQWGEDLFGDMSGLTSLEACGENPYYNQPTPEEQEVYNDCRSVWTEQNRT